MKRPTGINLIGIYYLIVGILTFVWSLFILGVGGVSALFGSVFGAENLAAFGGSNAWSGYLGLITAVVQVAVAFGLFAAQKWAWYVTFIGVALSVITGVVGMFSGGIFAFICGSLGLIIPVIILIYMLSKNVRTAFGVN